MTIVAESDQYVIMNDRKGEGTFGVVYVGYLKRDKTAKLAFKILKPSTKCYGIMQANNIREATFISYISDELGNVPENPFVPCLDIFAGDQLKNVINNQHDIQQSLIIVQPLYRCDLSQLIQSKSYDTFSYQDIMCLIKKQLQLIIKCHELCVSHRDLKPNNIVLDQAFNMKLIDFGMVQYNNDDFQVFDGESDSSAENKSGAINALCWRPLEQEYNKHLIKKYRPNLFNSMLSRIKDGRLADSYVTGVIILETIIGGHFFTYVNKEEEGGLEEIIAQHLLLDGKMLANTQFLQAKIDKQKVLTYLNRLNESSFSDLDTAESWNTLTLKQVVLKTMLIRFVEEVRTDVSKLNQLVKLASLVSELMNDDIFQRKTLLQLKEEGQYKNLINTFTNLATLDAQNMDISLGGKSSIFAEKLKKLGGNTEGPLIKNIISLQNHEIDQYMNSFS